jgi:RHS repeat-associated protein
MKKRSKKVSLPVFRVGLYLLLPVLLGIFALPLSAQTVEPRSGFLQLSSSDLSLNAGAIILEIRRTLLPQKGVPGLAGPQWRLTFENRLTKENNLIRLEGEGGSISFFREPESTEFKNPWGERLILDPKGLAVYRKRDGSRETYDEEGFLIERDFRNNNKVRFIYEKDHRLSRIEGPKGSVLKLQTDSRGRLVRVESSRGGEVSYQYDGEHLLRVQTNGNPPVLYQYNGQGQLIKVEDPRTGTQEIDYDPEGRVSVRRFADGTRELHQYGELQEHRLTDPAGGLTVMKWSEDGARQEITNPLGHKTVIESTPTGLPLSITDALGCRMQYSYDGLGRMTGLKDRAGKTTRYEYLNETGRLKRLLRPDGPALSFEYDGQFNLKEVRLGAQPIIQKTYGPDGLVTGLKEWGRPEERYAYDPAGRMISRGNALGQQTRFEYDSRGNRTRRVNPLGGVTHYQYNSQDQLISQTDPDGRTFRFEYASRGLLSGMTDGAGNATSYHYDARGRLAQGTDANGQTSRREYDALGRVVRISSPGWAEERFQYDPAGNRIGWTDSLNRSRRFEYDTLGRMVKEKAASGFEVSYQYDPMGNLSSWRDNQGGGEDYSYNGDQQVVEKKTLQGAVYRFAYSPAGDLLSVTDPLGREKRFAYNGSGELAEVKEPNGSAARYSYDPAGRLSSAGHPGGGESRFSYDSSGNLVQTVNPLGPGVGYTYDPAGRLISQNSAGQIRSYAYDVNGRLQEERFPDQRKIMYQYDRLGNSTVADDGSFPVRISRDPQGRKTGIEYPALKRSLHYVYDAEGRCLKEVDSEGREIRYEYDQERRVKEIRLPEGKVFRLDYDALDRLTAVAYPNGIKGSRKYDPFGRISEIDYADSRGKVLAGWRFSYDAAGNRIEAVSREGQKIRYQYDGADRLVEEAREGQAPIRYSYDLSGNRLKREEGGAGVAYRYDGADRLVQAGGISFRYDSQGRLVEKKGPKGITTYTYDSQDRLVRVTDTASGEVAYGYGPTGERIWRRDASGQTHFVTDGTNLLAELNGDLTPSATYLQAPGLDRPLMMTRSGKDYYFHADPLGTILLLTDEQGQKVAAYDYDAFGRIRQSEGSLKNSLQFTAREWDPAAGLYYFRARYYDPDLGRFITPDPATPRMDEPFDFNPYLYARGNPLRFIDPLGTSAGFTPAEQLYDAESALRQYRDIVQNPEKNGLGPGRDGLEMYEEQIRSLENEIAHLRSRGVTPQRPPEWGPEKPDFSMEEFLERLERRTSARGNQTMKVPVANPPEGGGIPVGGSRGPGTIRMPIGQGNPSGSGIGLSPGTLTRSIGAAGGVIGGVGIGVMVMACIDEGQSPARCMAEFGFVFGTSLLVAGALSPLILAGGTTATVVSVGGAALATVGTWAAGNRWSEAPETKALLAQQAAQQAQDEARVQKIVNELQSKINQLTTLGQQVCSAQSTANDSAMKTQTAAEKAKKNLEAEIGAINSAVSQDLLNSCIQDQEKFKNFPVKIQKGEEWISEAGQAIDEAISRLTACSSKKDLTDGDALVEIVTRLSLAGEKKLNEAQADIDALLISIPNNKNTVKIIRSRMDNLENSYLANLQEMDNLVTETEKWANELETKTAEFNTSKVDLTRTASNLGSVIPAKFQADLAALQQKVADINPPCQVSSPEKYRGMASSAKSSISLGMPGSLAQLGGLWNLGPMALKKVAIDAVLNTCGSLNPPTGRETENGLGKLVNLGSRLNNGLAEISKLQESCLAKLNPPTLPSSTSVSSGGSTLQGFSWACIPDNEVDLGGTVKCQAAAYFDGDPNVRDVTEKATWSPKSTFTVTEMPAGGYITVGFEFMGESGTKLIKVVDRKTTAATDPGKLKTAETGGGSGGSDPGLQVALKTNIGNAYQQGLTEQQQKEAQNTLETMGSTQGERQQATEEQQLREKSETQAQGQATNQAIAGNAQEFTSSLQAQQGDQKNALGNILTQSLLGGLTSGVATGINNYFGTLGNAAGQQVGTNWGLQPPPPPVNTGCPGGDCTGGTPVSGPSAGSQTGGQKTGGTTSPSQTGGSTGGTPSTGQTTGGQTSGQQTRTSSTSSSGGSASGTQSSGQSSGSQTGGQKTGSSSSTTSTGSTTGGTQTTQTSPTAARPLPPNCMDCMLSCTAGHNPREENLAVLKANTIAEYNCRKGCYSGACFQTCQYNCFGKGTACLNACIEERDTSNKNMDRSLELWLQGKYR